MKKILLSTIYFLACIFSTQAQILYGATPDGGDRGVGTINKFISATNNLIVAKSLESFAFSPLFTNFIQASDGKLYGMTNQEGSNGGGIIFSFDPIASSYTELKDFNNTNGGNPSGSLMQASNGKLYGMTESGGNNGVGVIFSFDPVSSTYTKLKDFDNTNGGNPEGNLVQAKDGKLYGMTINGGSNGVGVIFSFDLSTSTYKKLKDFDNINGAVPRGSFVQAKNGKLYGMTYLGGSNSVGVVFSFDPSTLTYKKLQDFIYTNGASPFGSLMEASNGKLYGMTSDGGNKFSGVVFSIDPSTSTFKKLLDFDGNDGIAYGNFIQAKDGKLYGMKGDINNGGRGAIFSFDFASSTYKKLRDFDGAGGAGGTGSLLQATNGKLYGMTHAGGSSNKGVIFSFDVSSSIYTKLKDFGTNKTGSFFQAGLVQASNGRLYGMTSSGGKNGHGVIFSYDASTSAYKTVKDFDVTDGSITYGSLIQVSNGKLYGMAVYGGTSDVGTIFSFDPVSSTYTKLKDFDFTNGANPSGSLIQASDGKLYGMTNQGGTNGGGGVIFSFDFSTSAYTIVSQFDGFNGSGPYGSLIQATNGKLYGMTENGGNNGLGVIFSFDPATSTYKKLKDFDGTNGAQPWGSLTQATDGKLYGMTSMGGSKDSGVIFSFNPSTLIYKKLKDFNGADGTNPLGNLIQASDGKLYGMTNHGGSSDRGVIFSFDPLSSKYKKLKDYNGANGANPYIGSSFIEINNNNQNQPPSVSLILPDNNTVYAAPANIFLRAAASDKDGSVTQVQFYNGSNLLHTEYVAPYGFLWKDVLVSSYTLTAKAIDNSGLSATSADVHVSVITSSTPVVNITSPANNSTFTAPASIKINAAATDPAGINKVEFYNGTKLLHTEHLAPYGFLFSNVSAGKYTLTVKATNNNGVAATSVVHVTVTTKNNTIAITPDVKISGMENQPLGFNLAPNPVHNTLNISINGQLNKPTELYVLSASGVVLKNIHSLTSNQLPLDVSSLANGVYFIKIICGNKVMYKQFVKM